MEKETNPREAAAREHELKMKVDQEMKKLGLDNLTFSPETAREDWEKLFKYYGKDVLPHALSIYSIPETLQRYAPGTEEVSRRQIDAMTRVFKKETYPGDGYSAGYGFDQPFLIPREFCGDDTDLRGFFGKEDYLKKYRGPHVNSDSELNTASRAGKPIFINGGSFKKLTEELYEGAMENLTKKRESPYHGSTGESWGPKFLEDIRRLVASSVEAGVEVEQNFSAIEKKQHDKFGGKETRKRVTAVI
jgi:hypothetical protein